MQRQNTFPVPLATDKTLFYIQKTPNKNTIIYDLNSEKGKIDTENPVDFYWIRYSEKGQKERLNFIQEHYAYGLRTKPLGDDRYELHFVSYKKLAFFLTRSPRDHKFHIQTTVSGKVIEVNRIFIQIEGGSFWIPNITCVEVKGVDPGTGKEVVQNFKP